jgi:hypothetical protein
MDSEQRVIVRFLYREELAPAKIHTRLKAQYGDDAYSLRSVQHWCQFVRQGRENRHDDDRVGRPTLDFIDFKIIAFLDREPFYSAYSLADAISILHSIILRYLKNSLGMKTFIFDRFHTC